MARHNSEAVATLNAVGEKGNLDRIYPFKLLCDTYIKGRCASEANGALLYYDDDHLSNEGAMLVVGEVMKLLN